MTQHASKSTSPPRPKRDVLPSLFIGCAAVLTGLWIALLTWGVFAVASWLET